MSKGSKMNFQAGKQNIHVSEDASLHQLFCSMKEVLNGSPKKDKIFIKNELKIKPLMEVGKHSLNDECSPLAIVNFKLIQAAFKNFQETSKEDLQPFSEDNNQWKGSYFISHGDSNAAVVSEESDLERALNELQMSEISNNISDPEVLDFCNNQLLEKSFSESLYASMSGELSPYHSLHLPELASSANVANDDPFILIAPNTNEICDNLASETFNLPLIGDHKLKISKPVKHKKTIFSKRKKCKKKSLFSIAQPKSVLVRNVNSTDSFEIGFTSETKKNNHTNVEKNVATTESNLTIQQQQQLGSTVSISPESKVVVKNHCMKSKKLKKNLKKIVKVKITRPPKDSEAPKKNPEMISKVQNSTVPLHLSKLDDCDKTTNNVIKSPNSVLQAETLSQISEQQSEKNSQILNKIVSQIQSPSNSSQVLKQVNKNNCEFSDKSPKADLLSQSATDMLGKLIQCPKNILQTKSPVTKSTSKGELYKDSNYTNKDLSTLKDDSMQFNTINGLQNHDSDFVGCEMDKDRNSLLDQSISNRKVDSSFSEDKGSTKTESVFSHHSLYHKDSTGKDSASLDAEFPKQKIPQKGVEQSSSSKGDEDVLDYEYSPLSDLSESESLCPDNHIQDSFLEDEEMPSQDSSYGATDNYDTGVANKTSSEASSIQSNGTSPDDKHLTTSSKYNVDSEDIVLPSMNGEVNASKHDVDMRIQWVPAKKERGTKRPAAFSDDDDSNSDSEQSFKRRNNSTPPQNSFQNIPKEQLPSSHSAKFDEVPDKHFEKLDNVIEHIRFLCVNHKITEAVHLSNKYLDISNSRSVCLDIFAEIIFGIKNSISLTDDVPEDPLKEIFDKLKAFIASPEAQKRDWRFCSKVIHKYFQHSLLTEFPLDLCTFCQTKGIAISSQAIEAYANNAMSRNYLTPKLIKFLDYVKRVCKQSFPKSLLRHVLERVTRGKECYLLSNFSELCNLLCRLEAHEVGKQSLLKFMEICVENDCWEQIAQFFITWTGKGHFPRVLLQVLWTKLGYSGILFKKLASEVYGNGELAAECATLFGIMGIVLMMECYHRGLLEEKQPENDCIISANEVLYTLNEYNFNFFYLAGSLWDAEWIREKESADPDPATVILYPYNVIFTAVEICLHLGKPRNAFMIFRNYSTNLQKVPNSFKTSVRVKHCKLFLEVTRLLQQWDPLDTGLRAFQEFVSTLEKDSFLEDLKGTDVDLSAIENIYNDLLVTYMNKSIFSNVYDLYQLSRGPCESLLPIEAQVLRGLVVTFAKHQKLDDARSLFALGCHQKIYQFEKPQPEVLPFKVTLSSNLTSQEMMFVIEKFLHMMFPILRINKPKNTQFEDWFALKIAFKELPCTPSKINCLIVPSVPNALKRACSILHLICPDFIWTENGDYILLSHDTVYNYWYKNYAAIQDKSFSVIQSRPLAFGLDSDSASNVSAGSLSEAQSFPQKTTPNHNSSPSKHHLPGEVSSTTSDHGQSGKRTISFDDPDNQTKRRISFSSSERSSSRTPENRLSSDRESRPLQRQTRPFPSGLIVPSSNDCLNEALEPHRTSSNDMSPLSNCTSKKIATRPNPSLFSPPSVITGQSPQKVVSPVIRSSMNRTSSNDMSQLSNCTSKKIATRLNPSLFSPPSVIRGQSPQKVVSSVIHSSGTSPKQKDSNSVSPKGIPLALNSRETFHSPMQQVNENISHGNSNFVNRLNSPKFHSPKQHASGNISPWIANCEQKRDTSTNDFIKNHKNMASRPGLLISPPKNSFGNASPLVGDNKSLTKSELPKSTVRDLNMPSKGGLAFENFTVTTCSSGRTRFAKRSPLKKVRKIKMSKTVKSQKVNSSNTTAHKDCNLTTSDKAVSPIQHLSATQSFADHVSPSSSPELSQFLSPPPKQSHLTASHSPNPELSHPAALPSQSPELQPPPAHKKLKAKRRLLLRKVAETPKLPPYRIQTPCKQARVIRPVTPIIKSSNLRCVTPLSFQSASKTSQRNYKKPITFNSRASNSDWDVQHEVAPTFKQPQTKFQNIAVSLQNSLASRIIATAPTWKTAEPQVKRRNMVQASCSNDVPKDVFEKVVTYLKSKVSLKFKNIDANQLLDKATTLANTFIKNNSVQRLDSKTMKLLFEFAKNIE